MGFPIFKDTPHSTLIPSYPPIHLLNIDLVEMLKTTIELDGRMPIPMRLDALMTVCPMSSIIELSYKCQKTASTQRQRMFIKIIIPPLKVCVCGRGFTNAQEPRACATRGVLPSRRLDPLLVEFSVSILVCN